MWVYAEILGAAARGLAQREGELRAEQAVRGLDAQSELELHPLLAASLASQGWGVWREVPYPGAVGRPGQRPKRAQRERCDLVLTPGPDQPPADPVAILRAHDAAADTLFERQARSAPGTPPEECCWLEVKVVGQHACTHAVPGPNAAYSTELTRALGEDVLKLNAEPGVRFGGVLVVLFTAEEAIACHDLAIACHRALDRGARFRAPLREGFEITDRIGNRRCDAVLVGV